MPNTEVVQPFPRTGLLANNLNLPLPLLADRIRKVENGIYSYVVRTVKLNRNTLSFEQRGSAPNFQGDVLTLCTCKHQMRSRRSAKEWQSEVWIAGFTSRTLLEGKHWLFYLAKIQSAYESHSDLWRNMNADTRDAKAAHTNFLGDVYKPKKPLPKGNARYSPNCYRTPSAHVHHQRPNDTHWKNDINYRHADKFGHPPLLVADPRLTFLWEEPIISFARDHCRNYLRWTSLQDLVARLR